MNLTSAPLPLVRASLRALLGLPRPVLARIGGARARADGGQRLDPQIAAALAMSERVGPPPVEDHAPAQARVLAARGLAPFDARPRPMAAIRDIVMDAERPIPARVYRPGGARAGGPAVVYYHGGGGVIGSVATYDPVCRALAHDTGYPVISVDYRLAPEHPFPAGVDDALAAYCWVRAHAAALDIDPGRIAVTGDSMGGTFAAVVCQQARDAGLPAPALQALLYPGLDSTFSCASHQTFAHGYLLTASLLRWFHGHYLTDPAQRWDLRASPLLATRLDRLPRALIVTAGFDPLRDEGALYAERLARAGVDVRCRCERSLIHGYVSMTGIIHAARRAVARMNAEIRALLA